jgi:hypothetical protein
MDILPKEDFIITTIKNAKIKASHAASLVSKEEQKKKYMEVILNEEHKLRLCLQEEEGIVIDYRYDYLINELLK